MSISIFGPIRCTSWDPQDPHDQVLTIEGKDEESQRLVDAIAAGRVTWIVLGGGVSKVKFATNTTIHLKHVAPNPTPPIPAIRTGIVVPKTPATLFIAAG